MSRVDADLIRIVALACNDVRTPMATLTGHLRTLLAAGLDEPAAGYARTVAGAAAQIDEIVGELGLLARIEEQRYQPPRRVLELRALLEAVAALFEEGRITLSGSGAAVSVDEEPCRRALASLLRTTMRNGALDTLHVALDGTELVVAPIEPNARPVVTGAEVREFSAAAALRVLAAQGVTLRLDGDRLTLQLPSAQ